MPPLIARLAASLLAAPAAAWTRSQERRILRDGRPLTPCEIEDAHAAGVREPEKIRILEVDEIPNPFRGIFATLEGCTSLCISRAIGMALRYGIFLVSSHHARDRRSIVVHEFAHTAQYEAAGSHRRFLTCYIRECIESGYLDANLEKDARHRAARICRQ